jgi:hypothetical protein
MVARAEIHGEHNALLTSKGKLAFLTEVVESWRDSLLRYQHGETKKQVSHPTGAGTTALRAERRAWLARAAELYARLV